MKEVNPMNEVLTIAIYDLGLEEELIVDNGDGTIDYNGDVDISGLKLDSLPIKFNRVYGSFDCSDNELTSLKGCPRFVDGDFYCYLNNLSTLDYGPKEVCGNYICSGNVLQSLRGSPKEIHGDFVCSNNLLKSLKYCPEIIRGSLMATSNNITTSIFLPKIIEKNFLHDIPINNRYISDFSYVGIHLQNISMDDFTVTKEELDKLGDLDPDSIFIPEEEE
jgi:hypothetical protein